MRGARGTGRLDVAARAILFDLDGTLADTAMDLAAALNRLLGERGLDPVSPELARPHTSSGARGLLRIGFGLTPGDPDYAALRERFLELYGESLCVDTKLYEGIPELLLHLESRSVPWGIVTNKSARFTEPLLELLGLRRRAACVVSGDTTGKIKPAPDPLLRAAADLGIAAADCLYIGDDLRDIQAARSANMGAIAAGWGYLGANGAPATWGADGVAERPEQVLRYLA
ncbi:MAG: HAD-IA family hydrolase [Betaproteobacteria bacterium]|nr:HAD-IA family hydrolase [Betaproteobacteria bacterium]